jgi:hypothetical protein
MLTRPAMNGKEDVDWLVFHITPWNKDRMAYMGAGRKLVENQTGLYNPLVIFLLYPLQMCSI